MEVLLRNDPEDVTGGRANRSSIVVESEAGEKLAVIWRVMYEYSVA